MTRTALIYAWTVIATGVAVLGCAALGWQSSNGAAWLVCLGLATLSATFKVRLPRLTGTISPAFVFLLVSVATRSWSETVAIGTVSAIVQCLWRAQRRPTALQVAFNAASMAIAAGVSHGVAQRLTAMGGADVLTVVLGAAGVALLITNTLLISTILCLIQERPFHTVWRAVQLWAVPYYLAGGVLASVWARSEFTVSSGVTILAAASVYLLSVCYNELSLSIGDKGSRCAVQ